MKRSVSFPVMSPEILAPLRKHRSALIGVAVFSGITNLLALTSSIYMLQLYDRVIPAHSLPTLIGLSVLMLMLFAAFGVLDLVRVRILSRIGLCVDRDLRERTFGSVLEMPLRIKPAGDGLLPVRDLDAVRNFLTSTGPTALFDMPWMPFYLALIYVLHPLLGVLATCGALVLVGLTMLTEVRTRKPSQAASAGAAVRQALGEAGRRNAEVVRALGMGRRMTQSWSTATERFLADQVTAVDVGARFGTMSKVLRFVLQSAVLGLGAYLVIIGQATGGVIIAASIMTSRALAPVEVAIANWRSFLSARQSAQRLAHLFASMPATRERVALPKPEARLTVDDVWIAAPGRSKPIVQSATFSVDAGAGLGIIGPSASGKSTLARALVGAWSPSRGAIRLDGASLEHWPSDDLGTHVGYLPQDIELFEGTVAQNIARLDPDADAAAIVAAAKDAGVHEMVLGLPDGYETRLGGDASDGLSAGQRQRIALARALYGNPFLVVLDEPNSNLDADGDAALTRAIRSVRARGGIAIVIAHRPSALAALDLLLVMGNGRVQAFGGKDEVLRHAAQTAAAQSARLKVVAEGG